MEIIRLERMISMPWDMNDFPSAFKNFDPLLRKKAIDISNALLDNDYPEDKAIPIAISQAKEWFSDASKDEKEAYQNEKDPTKTDKHDTSAQIQIYWTMMWKFILLMILGLSKQKKLNVPVIHLIKKQKLLIVLKKLPRIKNPLLFDTQKMERNKTSNGLEVKYLLCAYRRAASGNLHS